MRSYPIDPEPFAGSAHPLHVVDCTEQPVIARLYAISGVLMEILGPMFWAALIVLFLQAECFAD